jgi:D-2-hydroxyacid dehydrogenase (NADP+)
MLPSKDKTRILFIHGAYQMAARFAERKTGIAHVQVKNADEAAPHIADADVVCVSMAWKNDLIAKAPKLRFVQSISAGIDQYDQATLRARGIRLASAAGVNANAVAEHAFAMALALQRQLHTGRDQQHAKHWRGMISDIPKREAEIAGKTMLIVGLGRIGSRLARFARAFDMHVIGVKRDVSAGQDGANDVVAISDLMNVLPRADVVVLACPLNTDTEGLMGVAQFAVMKPGAHLINVARGKVVDEAALIDAVQSGQLGAAGIDVTHEEPLTATSPLWTMPQILLTPHTAGETQAYEDNVIDILLENLDKLWCGDSKLRNQVC